MKAPTDSAEEPVSFSAKGAVQMQLKLDGDVDWRPLEPFTKSKVVMLPAGVGEKTVQARFRDKAGNISTVAKDSITLQ